jgi:hypothetical protein
MGKDSHSVPVTVTVHTHQPAAHPGGHLPFTGAPIEALTASGLLLALCGAAVVSTVRRRVPPRTTEGEP